MSKIRRIKMAMRHFDATYAICMTMYMIVLLSWLIQQECRPVDSQVHLYTYKLRSLILGHKFIMPNAYVLAKFMAWVGKMAAFIAGGLALKMFAEDERKPE
jgi:hypothetical protein